MVVIGYVVFEIIVLKDLERAALFLKRAKAKTFKVIAATGLDFYFLFFPLGGRPRAVSIVFFYVLDYL